MKTPYLRLRWEEETIDSYLCHYELIIPLDKNDIRREIWENGEMIRKRSFLTVAMNADGPVRRTGGGVPCIIENSGYFYDAPYRDGAHAKWDSDKLGGIPVRVMAIDGTLMEMVDNRLVFC